MKLIELVANKKVANWVIKFEEVLRKHWYCLQLFCKWDDVWYYLKPIKDGILQQDS